MLKTARVYFGVLQLPWRLSAPLFVWIPLEANLGLGSLRSKDALTTSSVLERHKVILYPSLCYRTGFDATRDP